jgi:hypothetical protein
VRPLSVEADKASSLALSNSSRLAHIKVDGIRTHVQETCLILKADTVFQPLFSFLFYLAFAVLKPWACHYVFVETKDEI